MTALAWRDLRAMTIGDGELRTQRVTHLDEALELLTGRNVHINAELKVNGNDRSGGLHLADAFARRMEGVRDGNWLISSFNKAPLAQVARAQIDALDLLQPMSAMNTVQLERLYEEAKPTQPADLPVNGQPVDLAVGGRTFHLTQIFATAVGANIDLVVKYQEPDVSDTGKTFQSNMALIKGLSARYPELRSAFAAIIARAVTPAGQEYGTLIAVADIK